MKKLTAILLTLAMLLSFAGCVTQEDLDTAVEEAKAPLEAQIAQLNADIAAKAAEIETLEEEKAALTAEKAEAEEELEKIDGEIATLMEKVAKLEADGTADEAEIAKLKTDISDLEGKKTELSGKVTELEASITAKDTQITDLNSSIETLTAEKQTLSDRVAELEGENEALKDKVTALENCVKGDHDLTYTPNEDGTHTYICAVCKTEVTEEHTFVDGVCICGAVCSHNFVNCVCQDCEAKIEITGMVYIGDEAIYDAATNTYTVLVEPTSVKNKTLEVKFVGENLEYYADTYPNETMLMVREVSKIFGECVMPLYDCVYESYYSWGFYSRVNGNWWTIQYSNDGGQTWSEEVVTCEVRHGYDIVVKESQNGIVTVDRTYMGDGMTVDLTVTPDKDYMLDTLTVTDANGNPVNVENNAFTMPASDVTVSATFKIAE